MKWYLLIMLTVPLPSKSRYVPDDWKLKACAHRRSSRSHTLQIRLISPKLTYDSRMLFPHFIIERLACPGIPERVSTMPSNDIVGSYHHLAPCTVHCHWCTPCFMMKSLYRRRGRRAGCCELSICWRYGRLTCQGRLFENKISGSWKEIKLTYFLRFVMSAL